MPDKLLRTRLLIPSMGLSHEFLSTFKISNLFGDWAQGPRVPVFSIAGNLLPSELLLV